MNPKTKIKVARADLIDAVQEALDKAIKDHDKAKAKYDTERAKYDEKRDAIIADALAAVSADHAEVNYSRYAHAGTRTSVEFRVSSRKSMGPRPDPVTEREFNIPQMRTALAQLKLAHDEVISVSVEDFARYIGQ